MNLHGPAMRLSLLAFLFLSFTLAAQNPFNYAIELEPVTVPGLPGLHSYAVGQHEGMWLVIGGRLDGLHARQPFNSFPATHNNSDIYVIDVNSGAFWSTSLGPLPVGMEEQLQATNLNFCQDEDTLYIIGGYAYSASAADHITFPSLTSVIISSVVDAIMNGDDISPFFKQITDDHFAITGGQLGKIDDTFYLVGGHRFDGQYNPMGHPTYTQTYSNQIRSFTLHNSGGQLSYSNYDTITDPVHLHRRDYNLLPQVYPDGTHGYTISSGVFQEDVDLPFLYPVDITSSGYTPVTGFNQYLSHYHSARSCLYDSAANEMHSLFFGGMSQYYYDNGQLIQDDLVPFVRTISLLTRFSDGSLQEYQMPVEMPSLHGASAEFILNESLPHYRSDIIKLSDIEPDTILIGHIYGGIYSPTLNPFSNNQTTTTSADNTIYAVKLIRNSSIDIIEIDGQNPYSFEVYPNPASTYVKVDYFLEHPVDVRLVLATLEGKVLRQGNIQTGLTGLNSHNVELDADWPAQPLMLTLVFDGIYFHTETIVKK